VDQRLNSVEAESGGSRVTAGEKADLSPARYPVSKAALCVGFLALALLFNNLGTASLPSFDDAYHAQTAKEMLLRGDPITITYGGTPSFQSSPLPLWLMAPAYSVFGIGEYAARLPSALLGLAAIILIYFFARRRWGEEAAVAAAFILLATPLFLRYSRHAMAEVPLAFFCTAALLAFAEAQERPVYYYLFGSFTGLAILTKSALGLLPAIIALVFLVVSGKWRELFKPAFLLSGVLAAGIAAAWYIPALAMHGRVFTDSHIGAYLATHTLSGHHAELGLWGLFFYLVWVPFQYLPWTLLLLPALWWGIVDRRESSTSLLLMIAVILPLVILSLITSKYTRYLMPIFPAAALLIAATWARRLPKLWLKRIRAGIAWFSVIGVVGVIALPIDFAFDRNAEIKAISGTVKEQVPEGEKLYNVDLDFYEIQNPLLFYSDRLFSFPVEAPDRLWTGLKPGATRYALASKLDYAELPEAAEDVDVLSESSSGSLVFFSIHRAGASDWADDVAHLAENIKILVADEQIGCYRLPRGLIESSLHRLTGKRLLPPDDKPRRMIRAMERRGTLFGLSSARGFDDLRKLPHGLPRVVKVAESGRLVLFHIEAQPVE